MQYRLFQQLAQINAKCLVLMVYNKKIISNCSFVFYKVYIL